MFDLKLMRCFILQQTQFLVQFFERMEEIPFLLSCASPPKQQQRSPQHVEEYPNPINLFISPVAVSLTTDQIPKRRKWYSIREKLHYIQGVDYFLKKNPSQSLQFAVWQVKVAVSLLSKWKKLSFAFKLDKKGNTTERQSLLDPLKKNFFQNIFSMREQALPDDNIIIWIQVLNWAYLFVPKDR